MRSTWFALAAIAAGCHTERDETARSEAALVARQVQVLRDASNAEKPRCASLDNVPCTAADVCALKKACSDAYALQEEALAALAAVNHAASDARAPEAATLVRAPSRSSRAPGISRSSARPRDRGASSISPLSFGGSQGGGASA